MDMGSCTLRVRCGLIPMDTQLSERMRKCFFSIMFIAHELILRVLWLTCPFLIQNPLDPNFVFRYLFYF